MIDKSYIVKSVLEGIDLDTPDISINKKSISAEELTKKRLIMQFNDVIHQLYDKSENIDSIFYFRNNKIFEWLVDGDGKELSIDNITSFINQLKNIRIVLYLKYFYAGSLCSRYLSENEYTAIIDKVFPDKKVLYSIPLYSYKGDETAEAIDMNILLNLRRNAYVVKSPDDLWDLVKLDNMLLSAAKIKDKYITDIFVKSI